MDKPGSTKGDKIGVYCMLLTTLLDIVWPKGKHIDLMSIDVEGTELEVLSTLDFSKYSPTALVIEHDTEGLPSNLENLRTYMSGLPQYRERSMTKYNLIYVKE